MLLLNGLQVLLIVNRLVGKTAIGCDYLKEAGGCPARLRPQSQWQQHTEKYAQGSKGNIHD
ncbi:MAG: hypothetical protein D6730_20960 [Bacteroidetes bacterium]|nr:MAG: hypothetical protein D6730_20960 [Bacteroidota bacterium]